MRIIDTPIDDLKILEPKIFGDGRGFFLESFNQNVFNAAVGREVTFVQDNHSRSKQGVLRGMHYQIQQPQGKLVRVVKGSVFDVALDIRKSSSTFGHWYGVELSEENKRLFWVPEGFAHGFFVISESADFLYKTTEYYSPKDERCIQWNDPGVGIVWPAGVAPQLSAKDQEGKSLLEAEVFA